MTKNSVEGASLFFCPPIPPPLSAPQDYGNADAANQHYLREDML